jgi:hypothetical protein
MSKRMLGVFAVVVMATMIAVPKAVSQTQQAPIVYTYVSQFQVPRANWAQYSDDTEKTFIPVAEKLMADGTILGWSTFETLVHTPDGYTHGATWSSTTIAGLMKVLDEIRKSGPRPGQIAATKHEDLLLQTGMYHAGSGTPTYVRVVCQMAKPDKAGEYAAALKKYLVPTFDEQIAKGAATYYGLDEQYVNTAPPSIRCLVINYPNADGMDKWAMAVNAALGKMSQADRDSFFGTTVADSRRDILARVTHFGHK